MVCIVGFEVYSLAAGVRRTITRNTNATNATKRREWLECERECSFENLSFKKRHKFVLAGCNPKSCGFDRVYYSIDIQSVHALSFVVTIGDGQD